MPKGLLAALCALAALVVPATAVAAPNTNNSPKLPEAVSVPEIREHMANLQAIADANGGSRLAGASGHDASAAYVKQRLEAAGHDATYQEFTSTVLPRVARHARDARRHSAGDRAGEPGERGKGNFSSGAQIHDQAVW